MGRSNNRKMVFKQFTVKDERCAMKIGTDAVVLGALAEHNSPKSVLDIGTGSGIVALMLAQRFTESNVLALELEPNAYSQALENFNNSPFSSRLIAENVQFQSWSENCAENFDLIVTNPPFFNSQSKSPIEARNMARHDDYLKVEDIFKGVKRILSEGGRLVVVWPMERKQDLIKTAVESGFLVESMCHIRPTANHESVRFVATLLQGSNVETKHSELILEIGVGDDRRFTPEYLKLVKDFFLKA